MSKSDDSQKLKLNGFSLFQIINYPPYEVLKQYKTKEENFPPQITDEIERRIKTLETLIAKIGQRFGANDAKSMPATRVKTFLEAVKKKPINADIKTWADYNKVDPLLNSRPGDLRARPQQGGPEPPGRRDALDGLRRCRVSSHHHRPDPPLRVLRGPSQRRRGRTPALPKGRRDHHLQGSHPTRRDGPRQDRADEGKHRRVVGQRRLLPTVLNGAG